MSARVWLIEALDAAGAAPDDARIHARALAAAGCEVRTFVAGPAGVDALDGPRKNGNTTPPDLAIAASSTPGGGTAARHLPRGAAWAWWPTGVANTTRWRIGRQAQVLRFASAVPEASDALVSSTSEAAPRKRPVPLWDGEVVLVPTPLDRRHGGALVHAFAAAAGERGALDLVVLGEPQPEFTALARTAGIGARLHFAGPATREAEHAWFGTTAALLVDANAPVSGGLVLRALGRGVPVVAPGRSTSAHALRAWLATRGGPAVADHAPGDALAWALANGPTAGAPAARRRAVAMEHDLAALGRRLVVALGGIEGRRAA